MRSTNNYSVHQGKVVKIHCPIKCAAACCVIIERIISDSMANLDDLLSTYDYLDNRWFCTSRAPLYYPTHILNLTITQAGSIRTIPHPVISLWGRKSLLLRRSKTMKWWRREELQSAVNSLPDLSFSGGSDLSTIWICQNFDTLCPLSLPPPIVNAWYPCISEFLSHI